MTPTPTLAEILAESRRIRKEAQQILIDADYWNTSVRKPHEEVIDADPDGELAAIIRTQGEFIAQIERRLAKPPTILPEPEA